MNRQDRGALDICIGYIAGSLLFLRKWTKINLRLLMATSLKIISGISLTDIVENVMKKFFYAGFWK